MSEIYTAKNRWAIEQMPSVCVHELEHLSQKAKIATAFAERWGMVAGEPDGEDSKGRAKLKLSSEQAVVDRACKITELLFDRFNSEGWLDKVEPMSELMEKYQTEKEIA